MRIPTTESTVSVVLVGNFNPQIFRPLWFANHRAIGKQEAEEAEIEIIHPQIVKFSLDWLSVFVESTRFIAEMTQPPPVRIYDFIRLTFRELVPHTPISAMGINRKVLFDVGTESKRSEIGRRLAPPSAWGEWEKSILFSPDGKSHGGMRSLTMQEIPSDGRPRGYINTKVEPSEHSASSILTEVNDHYQIADNTANMYGCDEIMSLFESKFDNSIEHSEWIIDQVMSL